MTPLLTRRPSTWVLVACIALALAGGPARAQTNGGEAPPDDATKIGNCLEAVAKAGSDARACVGVVADPCLELPENTSPEANMACLARETKIWEALLATRYSEILELLAESASGQVRDVHRMWTDYRERKCAQGSAIYQEERLARLWQANCMLDETGRRAIELGAMLGEIKAR